MKKTISIGKTVNFRFMIIVFSTVIGLSIISVFLFMFGLISLKILLWGFLLGLSLGYNLYISLQYPNIRFNSKGIEIEYYNRLFYYSIEDYNGLIFVPSVFILSELGHSPIYLKLKEHKYPLNPHNLKMVIIGQKQYFEYLSQKINEALDAMSENGTI